MAPGQIGARQHHEFGELQVLVSARHRVGPKARRWPATEEDMQSRELVSIFAEPMKPFINLLAM